MKINIPYYHGSIPVDIPDKRIKAVLAPKPHNSGSKTEHEIVRRALGNPINSLPLSCLSAGKNNILIITSDHTRPVPSRITMALLLSEVRKGNPEAKIKILIATGFHRATTDEELIAKFGKEVFNAEDIIVHNAFDDTDMVSKGTLPSGGELKINRLVNWADLVVAEGFIEPHFFAGFSGGRKSVLPGICSNDTIMYNHNSRFIAHPCARTGVLDGNPLHVDMLYAAKAAGLAFILNVVINDEKKIVAAFAGHPETAHMKGCEFVRSHARVPVVKADIVVTSNGGYPLDQNVYQAVKGMTAAESCVNPGGLIIMASSCVDGHGGEGFYKWFSKYSSSEEITRRIHAIPSTETYSDQWEAQILARILTKCRQAVIVSRHTDPRLIEAMHMRHTATFEDALQIADELLGYQSDIIVIPNGVSLIIE